MGEEQDTSLEGMPQEIKGSFSGKRSLSMMKSLRNAMVKTAVQPIVSIKSIRVNRESSGKLLAFAIKVAALEIIRRHTHTRCPPIWTCIQSLPLLQVPPFSWLQCWGPFNYLLSGSQAFSKPILFLSLANTITDKVDELRTVEEPANSMVETCNNDENPGADYSEEVGPLAIVPANIAREQGTSQTSEYVSDGVTLLKRELEKSCVLLPDRIGDDELERFLLAANNNVKQCAALVKKNVRWRETFYFFPPYELEKWSSLVFWHGYDTRMRPSLVVRVGSAYSILKANERPSFAQAILSQVEYGVTHLLNEEDPRITVVIDCEGTSVIGFPVNMLKSCCARVQENYPTRLAALFVVNLPPVVRVITQTIIQVLKPATKRKIFVEGDQFNALIELYGSPDTMPVFLGGRCACSDCNKMALTSNTSLRLQLMGAEEGLEDDDDTDESDIDDVLGNEGEHSTYHLFNSVVRALIVVVLMLWVVVSLLAAFLDPEFDFPAAT